jgi:hypothetical protein
MYVVLSIGLCGISSCWNYVDEVASSLTNCLQIASPTVGLVAVVIGHFGSEADVRDDTTGLRFRMQLRLLGIKLQIYRKYAYRY